MCGVCRLQQVKPLQSARRTARITFVGLHVSFAMASAVGVGLRNPLAEDDVAVHTLLRLGPVQPKDISFKTTTILVAAYFNV